MANPNYIHARFLLPRPAKGDAPGFVLDLDLQLPGSGITAIFGPSGSGKSTFLRCVAGLERAPVAELSVGGEVWQNQRIFLPPHRRPLGYVFQEASLFPHLNVRGNLNYALRRAAPVGSGRLQADQICQLLGIEHLLEQAPARLSGGERQRVAIARALLINPRLLLMDEPMASLDETRRGEILPYLERLRDQLEVPILYVSHSASEITRLAHHLVVLDCGRATSSGALAEVMPRLDLGEEAGAVLHAQVTERDESWHLVRLGFAAGSLWVRDEGDAVGRMVRVRILARDVSLTLVEQRDSSIVNRLPGEVGEILPDGHPATCLVQVHLGPLVLPARLTRRSVEQLGIKPGVKVWTQIKSAAVVR